MEQYLSDQNQLHIFDNDNFSISCKNADLSAVDNFFDNIAHPYHPPIVKDFFLKKIDFFLPLP